jgi:hypothetical protein
MELLILAQAVALTNGATAILIAAATVLKAQKNGRVCARPLPPNHSANSAKPRSANHHAKTRPSRS